jgi:molecular chaperone HscB
MSFPTTIQVCRECGGGAPIDVHFCPQCTKILSLTRHGDYFDFFGLPRKLNLDLRDLEQRFRTLSRQFHPDFFYNATPAERLASLERASYLNDGYRTLHQPIARTEYLLKIEGLAPKGLEDASRQTPPPALLEEVFALNEELDEIREMRAAGAPHEAWTSRLARARLPIDARRLEHEAQLQELATRWDGLDAGAPDGRRQEVLAALRDCFLERNYITNLLSGIERELEHA